MTIETFSVNIKTWIHPLRFEDTATVTQGLSKQLGLVGMAARASGVERDVRKDFPWGHFRSATMPVSTMTSGDVFARAYVRWLEIQKSIAFIREQLKALPAGPVSTKVGVLAPGQIVVSLVEGWRGDKSEPPSHSPHHKITRFLPGTCLLQQKLSPAPS